MSTAEMPILKGSTLQHSDARWDKFPANSHYECSVLLCPDEEIGFYVVSLTLPGVASEGDNEQEAILNIAEALRGVLVEYRDSGMDIPWTPVEVGDAPRGSRELRILVNA